MLIVLDDMIADMKSNKIVSPIVTELFIERRELNILFVFISKSYSKVPETIRLNPTHYFIIKIPNKRELQQIASKQLSKINLKHSIKIYKDYTKYCIFSERYKFVVRRFIKMCTYYKY